MSRYSNGYNSSVRGPMQNGRNNDLFDKEFKKTDWAKEKMIEIRKNFYTEDHGVSVMHTEEIDKYKREFEIVTFGDSVPRPIFKLSEAGLPQWATTYFKENNFSIPTPIQSQSWPIALSGYDMIGIAKTGSGKTLSYLIPAIVHLAAQPRVSYGEGPIVLVLCPTRELAQQVHQIAHEVSRRVGVRSVSIYGGAPKGPQIYQLSKGVEVVIATPGRLMDMIAIEKTNLKRCTFLILDEADRMLDMGFEPQIRKIVEQTRPDRQTLMFSATWPKEVQNLARKFLKKPISVNIGKDDLSASHQITQSIEICAEHEKKQKLEKLLTSLITNPDHKILIFTDKKVTCDQLVQDLRYSKFPVLGIHGDKTQQERDWVLKEFRGGRMSILIATDVASRGLDIPDINYVINFDFPTSVEDYIHRIGRTGRASKRGDAHTFFTYENSKHAAKLVKVLQEAKQEVPDALYTLSSCSDQGSRRTGWRRQNGMFPKNTEFRNNSNRGGGGYSQGDRWDRDYKKTDRSRHSDQDGGSNSFRHSSFKDRNSNRRDVPSHSSSRRHEHFD